MIRSSPKYYYSDINLVSVLKGRVEHCEKIFNIHQCCNMNNFVYIFVIVQTKLYIGVFGAISCHIATIQTGFCFCLYCQFTNFVYLSQSPEVIIRCVRTNLKIYMAYKTVSCFILICYLWVKSFYGPVVLLISWSVFKSYSQS